MVTCGGRLYAPGAPLGQSCDLGRERERERGERERGERERDLGVIQNTCTVVYQCSTSPAVTG